ncbi:MAG: hypothetical protein PHS57_00805 [Alphaproteobacteria bacterium]|nr:hypothetical protein [Alphaproteobacteria bacterium]
MQKKTFFVSLVATGILSASIALPAKADSIWVIDDYSERSFNELQYLFGAVAGDENSPATSSTYNTNHLLQEILGELGGATENGKGTASSVFNTNALLATSFLGRYGNDPANGYLNPDALLVLDPALSGAGLVDGSVLASTAQDDARMRYSKTAGDTEAATTLFDFSCKSGFLLTSDAFSEGTAIKKKCAITDSDRVGRDRSMESLLGPIQYLAPTAMAAPSDATSVYVRFNAEINATYTPIYAAAGFCQNIAQNSRVPVNVNAKLEKPTVVGYAFLESRDSHIAANCWRFFEERVQYPEGMPGILAQRHEAQKNRCQVDYQNHIISAAALADCQSNGRSALKARADRAFRLDSEEYVNYLNTLGITTREMLISSALDAQEPFEQHLLLERQIMTESLLATPKSANVSTSRIVTVKTGGQGNSTPTQEEGH